MSAPPPCRGKLPCRAGAPRRTCACRREPHRRPPAALVAEHRFTATMSDTAKAALPATAPAALVANAPILDAAEITTARMLLACGQAHLFEAWEPPGEADEKKHAFFDQVAALDEAYPGGLAAYIGRARKLLAAAGAGDNPLSGWTPSVPAAGAGLALEPGSEPFLAYESRGLEAAVGLGFVVTAGGLGERLGFSGIKLALPSEIATGTTVLNLYCAHILAYVVARASERGAGLTCLWHTTFAVARASERAQCSPPVDWT
jgi:hypothetical protein